MSRILMITSSYRQGSNSNALGAAVAAGAREKGHEVEIIDIARLHINPCRGCMCCLQAGSNFCVIKDDMHALYPRIVHAETLIFVSPIYWFNICGQLKQFVDRCFAVAISPDQNAPSPFKAKKLGAVLVYGDDDPLISGCVNAVRSFQDLCAYTGATWAKALYGSAHEPGEVASNTVLLEKARTYGLSL